MLKLNVDQLIDEYLDKARSILHKSDIKYEKTEVDLYKASITLDNFKEYRQKYLEDNDYQYLYEIFDYIIGALQRYEAIIYEILYNNIKNGIICVIAFYLLGVLLILFSIFYTINLIKEIRISLKELINIIFIIPSSAVENSVEFKKFIEKGY